MKHQFRILNAAKAILCALFFRLSYRLDEWCENDCWCLCTFSLYFNSFFSSRFSSFSLALPVHSRAEQTQKSEKFYSLFIFHLQTDVTSTFKLPMVFRFILGFPCCVIKTKIEADAANVAVIDINLYIL